MSEKVLMKNGVALWLVNHTSLSSEQIGEFCNMHPLQVECLKMNSAGIIECNPIVSLIVDENEIKECQKDTNKKVKGLNLDFNKRKTVSRNMNLYNGILWLLNKNSEYPINKIAKLLSCNVVTIKSIKNGEFKYLNELVPQNPISLGLCTAEEFDIFIQNN